MTYALRKLIAFVFLGGMFWFIYQDLDNLDKPWFLHALGLITIVFAFFWLLIPMLVVWYRIRCRRAQNESRYREWLAAGGATSIRPLPARSSKGMATDKDERVFYHEKGTLYVSLGTPGFDTIMRPAGRPSDVAFPGYRRKCHICQRTHGYITNRRIVFLGKDLDIAIPFAELDDFSVTPGGIVFKSGRFAFTFQNPLIVADILRFAEDGGNGVE